MNIPGAPQVAHIVCAADETYALPLGVMLESLLDHVDPQARPVIHIVDCGLGASSRGRIGELTHGRSDVAWHRSRRSEELGDPAWGHVTGATYERLLLDEYLPEGVARPLWLDCDLLVLDDPTVLLRTNPNGAVVHAVRDPLVPTVSASFGIRSWRQLGLERDTPYFNAGVMCIDMSCWREMDISGRALAYLERHGRRVFFNEQEALNAVIGADWVQLDDRWNLSANPIHARRQSPGGDPAIVHFAGRVKPWNVPGLGSHQELYYRYLDNTPWRGARPVPTLANRLLSWYLGSDLRRVTYWLENQELRLRHHWGV